MGADERGRGHRTRREAKQQRLRGLLDRYNDDFARCVPSRRRQFGCPRCGRSFPLLPDVPIEAIVAEEHIVPGALAGRLTTLTCRSCNNDDGSELDAHLIQRVRIEHRTNPLVVRVEIGGTEQSQDEVFDTSEQWKAAMLQKDWGAGPP
jgi:hypothetical protein